MRSTVKTLLAGLAAAFFLLVPATAPAWATDPVTIPSGTNIVDPQGALGSRKGEVQKAISDLLSQHRVNLYVVIVDSFTNPSDRTAWAQAVAKNTGMGGSDVLLAIATSGQFQLVANTQNAAVYPKVSAIAQNAVTPNLAGGKKDYAQAAIDTAKATGDAAAGGSGNVSSGSGAVPWLVGGGVVLVGAGAAYLISRRRKGSWAQSPDQDRSAQGEPDPLASLSVDELRTRAAGLLVRADDAVRSSEQELGFAEASYGSDAVGRVINLVLRDKFEGLETSLQAGTTTDGGGGEIVAGATAGHSWGSGRALLSYQYRLQDEIKAKDRSFTINLPDDWSLFPREHAHSVYGNVKQDLTAGLSLELSGIFAKRGTVRSYFMAGPALPVNADSGARSLGGTATLRMDLGHSWIGQLFGNAFRTTSRENQFQSGGSGFINRFDTVNSMREFGLSLDGNLFELPGGTAKLALGAQTRREHFSSLFETPVNPVTLESGSRNVRSAYGELYIPLVGARNRMPAVERLVLTAAGRFEHYDGLQSSFDPKLGILWAPTKDLTLRASYGTSFRAPLLSETLGVYNLFLFDAAILSVDPAEAPPGAGAVLVGTNPSLKPETSKSLSIGGEWTPAAVPGLTLRANYYRIVFSNRIALPSDDIVVIGNPALASMVTLDPSLTDVDALFAGANQVIDISGPGFTSGGATAADVVAIVDARFSNTAETRTSGLDLGLDYPFDVGANKFHIAIDANKVFRFDDRLIATSPVVHQLDTPFHPISWRARGGLSWTRGPWSANLFVNYTAAYHDNRPGIDRHVSSFTTLDGGIAYALEESSTPLLRGSRIALHVNNLFNASPPRLALEQGATRGIGYDPVNATGRGRTITLQLRKSFR